MKNKLLTLFLALVASVGTLFAQSGTCGTNLTWNIQDGTLTISGNGAMMDYTSTSMPWYSYRSSIFSVVISEGVSSIGKYAFGSCSSLTSITIPNSVTSIGTYAFYNCSKLTAVNISDIAAWCKIAFSNSDANPLYYAHNLYLNGTLVTDLIIPDGVTSIKNYAFQYCRSLTSVTIPNSVTSIGAHAFRDCSRLTSVTIPNSVTSIGDYAFLNCSSLTSITIPNGVTSIGRYAFQNCLSLTSVTIPNSVTSIKDYAFQYCGSLTSITCEAVNPQTLGDKVFVGVNKSIPLYVPAQSIDLYKAAYQWRDFTNILPITVVGTFSVSATQQVTFSPGNLQYQASTDTWRFAEHQWDIVGMGYGQTNTDNYCYIGGTVANGDNRNISSSYNGWIDLFGWGTSGWNSGANAYQPYSTSTSRSDYYPGGSYENSLTGDYANADWGVYNQIGDDAPGSWRTLTRDEWVYLFNTRANASSKYSAAKVNGVTGVVVLPDNWVLPYGCGFTSGMTSASNWYDWSYVATTNIYTSAQWQLMESAGAVFLPAAGCRCGTTVGDAGSYGRYWSSTQGGTTYAYDLYFYSSSLNPQGNDYRYLGRSVRLVRAAQNEQEPIYSLSVSVEGEGTVTGAGEYKSGTTATLTATAASGYTFSQWSDGNTDNPRDVIVTENATFIAVFEKNELPSDIILQENESADYYTQFANDYNGRTVTTATLNRQFTQGKWATLCLPFNVNKAMMMSLGLYNRVFAFRYAQQLDDETIQVFFVPAQSIEAGKGYIVNPNAKLAAKTSFVFPNVTINTDSDNGDITALTGYNDGTNRGNLFLVGTLRTGTLQGTTAGNTYLGLKDNRLYSPNITSGTSIRAYRGFFRSDIPVNASRLRIIADGETVSELQVVDTAPSDWSDKSDPSYTTARKYLRNGLLFIERNGITYTAQGQRID